MVGVLTAFFSQAAAPPPPYPNPVTKSLNWFHGTGHQFVDDNDEPDPDPGGRLRHMPLPGSEYGENSSKHWNTDLGIHFTSEHEIASRFANSDGTRSAHPYPDSRIAHVRLHMANPKHYDSEYDMARDAIKWAHKNGHHYVDHDTLSGGQDREDFINGDEHPDPDVAARLQPAIVGLGNQDREHIAEIDSEGPDHYHADKGAMDRQAGGTHLDNYLRFHPDREEITSGWRQHLEDKGHDGITYGNEYESIGGRPHTCAIAFDPDQVHLKRWQWLHESKQHLNDPDEGPPRPQEDPHLDHPKLVSPNYTPAEGHHWVGPDGKKLGVKAPPKPELVPAPEEASDDDKMAHWDAQRQIKNHWQSGIRRGLSEGRHSNQEAREAGYSGVGHDQHENGYEPHYGLKWEPLPKTLYHVTTHRDDVLAHGLKSRDELGQGKGKGLGGGESDTISFTEDPDTAHHIHRALHEYHSMLNKPMHEAVGQMMDEAERGGYADQVRNVEGDAVDRRLKGHVSVHDSEMTHIPMHQKFMTESEAKERIHPDAELDPQRTVHVPGEEPRSMAITRPATEDEAREQISSHYKTHAWMRAHHGGPMDPLFSQNDVHGFAKMDPKQFAVIKAHSKPGAQGYKMGSLGEWRTASSKAVDIDGVDEGLHRTAGLNGDLPKGYSLDVTEDPKTERWGLPALHVRTKHDGREVGGLSVHQRQGDDGLEGHPNVWVDEEHQRKGLATAMYAEVKRRWPDVPIIHSEHASDAAKALNRTLAALLPGYLHEHDWLPDHGIFSRTKAELDPVLFGRKGKMRKCVKKVVLARMDAAVHDVYPDWRDWTRSYFAGGEASFWWGNHDLDVLVGIDYDRFRRAHPEDADLTDEEISAKITRLWRLGYNSETWVAPWDGEEWHVTCFSNPASYRIQDIKPYAAYLLDDDTWVVRPPKVDKTWGPGSFPESYWNAAEGYLKAINGVSEIKDPTERAREGAALYEYLHGHRREAFGPDGKGWSDPANVLWKFLEYHPSAPVEKLVSWAHQWNEHRAQAAAA